MQIFGIPFGAKYLAIVVEDPDAPMQRPFIHLIAVNIPVNTWDITLNQQFLDFWLLWKNDFWNLWWGWPCPPKWDKPHHYIFKIYALKKKIDFKEWFSIDQFNNWLNKNKNYIIWEGKIVWIYKIS